MESELMMKHLDATPQRLARVWGLGLVNDCGYSRLSPVASRSDVVSSPA